MVIKFSSSQVAAGGFTNKFDQIEIGFNDIVYQ